MRWRWTVLTVGILALGTAFPAYSQNLSPAPRLTDVAANDPSTGALADPGDGPDPGICRLLTIAMGETSGFGYGQPGFLGADLIIRDPDTWLGFWALHAADHDPPPPQPPVDFRRHVVVATVQGPQPSGGGPNIAVLMVARHEQHFKIVIFDDERPGPLDVVTNPYHFVLVDRWCLPPGHSVMFEHVAPRPETGVVVGEVLGATPDDRPKPLPGAHVMLISDNAASDPCHTTTGMDGSFYFVNVPPGHYALRAEADGFDPETVPIHVPPDALVSHRFILMPTPQEPGAVTGRVMQETETAGTAPVPGAVLRLLRDGQVIDKTRTNNVGVYEFPEVMPGQYVLCVEHPRFLPQHREILVEPGQTRVESFVLEPRPPEVGVFAGIVFGVTDEGELIPIPRAKVALHSSGSLPPIVAHTNEFGVFVMINVPVGEYVAVASHPEWLPEDAAVEIFPNDVTFHVFELLPAPVPEAVGQADL